MSGDIEALQNQFSGAAEGAAFSYSIFGGAGKWPLIALSRKGTKGKRIYLSSGIHGDEPAGPQALLELLQEDLLPGQHHFWICPILNPAGLQAGIRENPEGIDLNRDYQELQSTEIRAHHTWISESIDRLDLGIHLHEDWESEGFYLYEAKSTGAESRAQAILAAAEKHLPIEQATAIDGWPAANGLIRVSDLPKDQVGSAESGFLQLKFRSRNYTLEAPSSLPMRTRVDALKEAVLTALQIEARVE